MIPYTFTPALVITIFFFHFVADFLLQTHWMASNKSKSVWPLLAHIAVYTTVLFFPFGWQFAVFNGFMHFVVDFITSKITAKLWSAGKVRPFFMVIGADQFAHAVCLILTAHLACYPVLNNVLALVAGFERGLALW